MKSQTISTGCAGQTFLTLTTSVDSTLVGSAGTTSTAGNDTFVANMDTVTFSVGDTINGGSGTDTLKIIKTAAIVAADVAPVGATLTSIENLEITSGAGLTAVATTGSGLSGVTQVTTTSLGASALTAAATQNVTMGVTGAVGAATAISLDGGLAVAVTATDTVASTATADGITIGATTAATGAVTVTNTVTSTDDAAGGTTTAGAIAVTGGTTVNVTQTMVASSAAVATVLTGNVTTSNTQGAVTVTGTSATTAVTVTQSAAVTAAPSTTAGVIGLINGAVTINDVNAASTTAAGKITTATITNAGAAAVNSGALTTLNLGGTLTTVNAGTLGALTTAANTALAVNLTGAVTSGAVTIDTDITTINISGSGTASTIASLVDASATAINISGSAAVTITADTVAATATFTSTNTAGTTLTQALAVGSQFVGGNGADTISIGQTTKAINMGAGNDVVIISNETLGTGGTLNGGTGTNTIVANTNTSTLSGNSNITNFTTLRVAGAAAQGAHNATGFTALEVGVTAGASSFTNVAAGAGLTMLDGPTGGVTYTLANSSGTSDVLNLVMSSKGALTGGTVTAAGVETINITATDTDTTAHTNTLTLAATSATSITVTGNSALTLTNTTETKVATFNASAVTAGAVTYTSATTTANSASTTITGGAGADVLTGGATADTISGGAGNDTITGGAGSDTIDGNAGTNTFSAGTAFLGAAVEGLNTGTATGMVVNLSSAAITAATINTAMTGTIGLSASLASVASGKTANIYATQDALFSTTQDTLTNIQNVTGSTGADYIAGSTAAGGVYNGGTGADVIIFNSTGIDNWVFAPGTSATMDSVTGFTALIDVAQISITGQAGSLLSNGNNGAITAGAAPVVKVISTATASGAGTTLAATDNIVILNGTLANTAAVKAHIGTSNALITATALTANSDLIVAWSDNTDSYISLVSDANAANDVTLLAANLTLTEVVKLVGVNAATLATFTAADFAFIA